MANSATIGFEQKLWAAADKMRNNMDSAEYKHVILGLIFLKYISDSFVEIHEKLEKDSASDPEDKDEYIAENVFWVPKKARWNYLKDNAKSPEIGKMVDDAMILIEKENPKLKGILSKDYARPALDKQRLGEIIDLLSGVELLEDKNNSKDVLGRVYEYFLGRFASAEGKGGGEFFTPQSIVKLLVELLEPYKGRIYDPCCGSGGMFVQGEKFVEVHGGKKDDLAIYGQESNPTTWRLCQMNLAIRGINGNFGEHFKKNSGHTEAIKKLLEEYIPQKTLKVHKKLVLGLFRDIRHNYLHEGVLMGREEDGGFLFNEDKMQELVENMVNIAVLTRSLIEQFLQKQAVGIIKANTNEKQITLKVPRDK